MMRLFVAVTPPRQVLLELRGAVASIAHLASSDGAQENGARLRWTRADQWHINLAFLGDVDEWRLAELRDRLGRVAARTAPMELSLAGGGRFGGRVLWVGVQGDRDRLARLAGAVCAASRRCHLRVDERPYRPHLTLARVHAAPAPSTSSPPAGVAPVDTAGDGTSGVDLSALVERLREFRSPGWFVGDVELFLSELPNAGASTTSPRYTRLDRWALTGR